MRIIIADDHAFIRKGLKHILLDEFPSASIEEAADAEGILKMSITHTWDIVICDMSMPGRSGLEVVQFMKQHFPKTPVLILSMYPEEQYALRAIKTGAAGYMSKDSAPEELIKAVHRILLGRRYISPSVADKLVNELDLDKSFKPPHEFLTQREFNVFQLLSAGKSTSEISEQLSLGASTISTYRSKILKKLDLKTNSDLIRYAMENKLI